MTLREIIQKLGNIFTGRELASFFEGLSGPVITFNESYVRRLLRRITIFDDKVIFAFKDGKEVTIKE